MIFLNQAGRVEGAVMDQAALVEPCDLGSRVEQHLQTLWMFLSSETDLFCEMSNSF